MGGHVNGDDLDLEDDDPIRSAIDQLGAGGDGTVRVNRYERHGAREVWARCTVIPVGDFDADQIGALYGPGRYRVQVVDGRGKIVKHSELTFAAPASSPAASAPPGAGASAPVAGDAAGAVSGSLIERMLLIMLQGLVNQRGGDNQMKPGDIIAAIRAGAEMSKGSGMSEAMEAIRTGAELNKIARGDDGGERGGGGFFENMGDRALGLVERLLTAPVPAAPAPAAEPAPAAPGGLPLNPPGAGAAPRVSLMGDPMIMMARKFAPKLLAEAEADRDPQVWAAFVSERIPEAFLPALVRFCQSDPAERIALLAQLEPRLRNYQAWIDAAAAAILEELTGNVDDDAGDGDEDAGGGSRDIAVPRGDAGIDPGVGSAPDHPAPGRADLPRQGAK